MSGQSTPPEQSVVLQQAASPKTVVIGHEDPSSATLPLDSAPEVSRVDAPLEPLGFAERYAHDKRLGEGGMGVVELYADHQVGRQVAMKLLRGDRESPQASARFVREARVQGQLEHPSVVPVYDLGIAPDGAIYFTMKRVRGISLEQIIEGLDTAQERFLALYSRRRLLTAFSSVCLAVDFAHERGVLHRDLKPGNIMLGDFGEVYVLDWGLARVRGAAEPGGEREAISVPPGPHAETMPGAILGTPGYMAPEQARGELDELGPHTDVYSLGCILFELMALERLHQGTTVQQIVSSTLVGAEARFSERVPEREIPPELEAIVVRATALDPARRYPNARELHEDIERFLDGERDVELRQDMAKLHASVARRAARSASSEDTLQSRRRAMQEIGRALALDPDNQQAMEVMIHLLSEPPKTLPPEVAIEIASSDRHKIRWMGKVGGWAYLSMLIYLPFFLWSGVNSWLWVGLFYFFVALSTGLSFFAAYRRRPNNWNVLAVMLTSNLMFGATAAFFGPLFVMPTLVAVNTMAFTLYLSPGDRPLTIATGCVVIVVFVLLSLEGLIPGGYVFSAAGITVTPGALALPELPSMVLLTAVALAGVITGSLSAMRVRDALANTERQLFLYTWHLREFVPVAARAPTDPTAKRRADLALDAEPRT